MDTAGSSDSHDSPASDAPLDAPPTPMATPTPVTPLAPPPAEPTQQIPQIVEATPPPAAPPAPTAYPTPFPPTAVTPAVAPAAPSVVIPQGATPKGRKPWLAVVAGVAILGLGAAAVIGWMGKADADDKLSASEEVADNLAQEVDTLRGELDAANQAAEDAAGELSDAQGEISVLEEQVDDLEGDIDDMTSEIDSLEQSLEEQESQNGNGVPGLNDLVLTEQEYRLVESSFDVAPPPIETARQLGAEMCAATSIREVVDVVMAYQPMFPPEASNDDVAVVAGAIAGLMCQDHLLTLAS